MKNYPHKNSILLVTDDILNKFRKDVIAIAIFGSVARGYEKANDADILILTRKKVSTNKFRRKLLENITPPIELDYDFHIRNEEKFRRLELMHFGLVYDNIILYDPENYLQSIIDKIKLLMKRWNTKRVFIDENDWLIYLRGEPTHETIELGIPLV